MGLSLDHAGLPLCVWASHIVSSASGPVSVLQGPWRRMVKCAIDNKTARLTHSWCGHDDPGSHYLTNPFHCGCLERVSNRDLASDHAQVAKTFWSIGGILVPGLTQLLLLSKTKTTSVMAPKWPMHQTSWNLYPNQAVEMGPSGHDRRQKKL